LRIGFGNRQHLWILRFAFEVQEPLGFCTSDDETRVSINLLKKKREGRGGRREREREEQRGRRGEGEDGERGRGRGRGGGGGGAPKKHMLMMVRQT
jgi:hypothetical protein